MDIEKAERASGLLTRAGFIRNVLDEMKTVWSMSPVGTTTVTVPRTWLPGIIGMAEEELARVEDEIAKL